MTRSLPESTVDAWTAISLAAQQADWIWSPTQPAGATWTGSHPGDISTYTSSRLVVIENKGVENGDRIDWGGDPAQRSYLRIIEEVGLDLLHATGRSAEAPRYGWIFYGLPIMPGKVDGTDWRRFPYRHALACPHWLDFHHAGPTTGTPLSSLTELDSTLSVCLHDLPQVIWSTTSVPPLTISLLRSYVESGHIGLPIGGQPVQFLDQLVTGIRQLVPDIAERLEFQPGAELPSDAMLSLSDHLGTLMQNPNIALM